MNEALQMIGFLLNACQQKDQQIQVLQSQLKVAQEAAKPHDTSTLTNGVDKSIPAS